MKLMATNARKASLGLSLAATETKNKVLAHIAKALKENAQIIFEENKKDIAEIPKEIRKEINFITATDAHEVFKKAIKF